MYNSLAKRMSDAHIIFQTGVGHTHDNYISDLEATIKCNERRSNVVFFNFLPVFCSGPADIFYHLYDSHLKYPVDVIS